MRQMIRATMAFAAMLLLLVAAPAAKADYPVREGELSSDTGDGTTAGSASDPMEPGDEITLSGSGYEPGSEITLTLESDPILLGTVKTDAAGSFRTTVRLPADVPAGEHTLKATGPAPGGGTLVLSQPVDIVASAVPGSGNGTTSEGDRPYDNAPIVLLVLAGLGVVGLAVARRVRS